MADSERQPLLADGAAENAHDHHNTRLRDKIKRFLGSNYGHYTVLFLVGVDTIGIFATFLIELYLCEHECKKVTDKYATLHETQRALEIISLIFSCLFMLELLASVFAFGLSYFKSWFHCLDATVIILAFVIDVALQGILEEVGSAVVVLRLWRVFKIVDEFSAGAQDQMDSLTERIRELEEENLTLRKRIPFESNNTDGTLHEQHGAV